MRASLCGAWALVTLAASWAHAVEVPPTIEGEQLWSAAGGPYQIEGAARVVEGARLEIEAGARVELGAGARLIVEGALIARGAEDAPILFTGDPEARWGPIHFTPASTPAAFEGLHAYASGSILEGCVFEHAARALHLEGAAPFIHDNTFRDNHAPPSVALEGGAAILIEAGASPRIMGNRFERNIVDFASYGGAVYVSAADPIIQGNVFRGNEAIYGGALATDLMASPIVGNRFEENAATATKGGAMALISSVSAILHNEISHNRAVLDGAGVHICVDCYPHATPSAMDNVITHNLSEDPDPLKGAAGFGAAFLRVFAYNQLHDNLRAGAPSDFGWYHHEEEGYPEWVAERSIAHNWWGGVDPAAIAAAIFDGDDAEGYHRVHFDPPLEAAPAPQPRLLLATRKLQYNEAGEPAPIFLTLYNPGAARAFEIRLLVQIDGLPPVPWRGLTLEGVDAQPEGDGLRVEMPANGVLFEQITAPDLEARPRARVVVWHAALFDADSGARLGDPQALRLDLLEVD